jgi:ubiquinone/menaquinone biosynthesis C-methylase UbiE
MATGEQFMVNQELFVKFLRVYAFQPATAFWRAVEVDVLTRFLPSTGHCLDLGCGDGKLTAIAFHGKTKEGLSLVGIDGDEYETQQAPQSFPYARVHTCWASNIPEPSASFDHVISNSVLEHIQDIEVTVKEVARLLKSGGTFLFTVPSPGFHRCLYGPLNPKSSREAYLLQMDKRLAHYRYWSTADWQDVLARYDLKIKDQVEYFNCKEVRRWESISRFTAGVLYALGRGRRTPMEIQKKSGLRDAQSKLTLPRWIARLLAMILSLGVKKTPTATQNACLLIHAYKQAGG